MADNSSPYVVKRKTLPKRLGAQLGQLDIELTERCNNACIHCLINLPEQDAAARAREMSADLVKDILQQAVELGCMTVRFTGGEPLLRPDFSELYLFARRLGMRVILFTNARLISEEIAQLLGRVPPGRLVEVTVYGMHPASYEAVALARGAFAEFWHGMGLLRQYNIPFIVKQSVLPPNRHEIEEFEAFAASLPRMERKPGYTMNFDLRARRDNPAKNRFIQSLRLSAEETVARLVENPQYLRGMRQFTGKFMGPPGEKLFNCGAGHGACVDAYGNAQMCMGLRHPEMVYPLDRTPSADGAKGGGLRYALEEFFPRFSELKATNPDYLRRCAVCFLKGLCEQCPAKSWQEHGTLDTPVEYLCTVAHAQARALGLLGAEEYSWDVPREESRRRVARFVAGEIQPAADASLQTVESRL